MGVPIKILKQRNKELFEDNCRMVEIIDTLTARNIELVILMEQQNKLIDATNKQIEGINNGNQSENSPN